MAIKQYDKVNPIVKSIQLIKQGKGLPVLRLVRDAPELSAMVSKLVTSPTSHVNYGLGGVKQLQNPNSLEMRQLSHRLARNASDAEITMQVLPDTELSAQILTSCILSPKDMTTVEINYIPPEGIVDPQLASELIVELRKHFDQIYKIKPLLSKILREILFEQGAHIRAVIPENSIDDMINRNNSVTMEDLREHIDQEGNIKNIGILGNGIGAGIQKTSSTGISLESFKNPLDTYRNASIDSRLHYAARKGDYPVLNPESGADAVKKLSFESLVDENIRITDNISILKIPGLHEKIRSQRVNELYNYGKARRNYSSEALADTQTRLSAGEAMVGMGADGKPKKLTDQEIAGATFRHISARHTPVAIMKTQEQLDRHTVGNPMIMELPTEAVIPVYTPGQEERHIGYFIILDNNGNPVSRKNMRDTYGELADRMSMGAGGSNQFASQLIQRVNALVNGFDYNNNQHLEYSARVYAEMVEADLLSRLRNGIYSNGAALARNEEVYRIMLSRTLSAQQTQLLFLPVEFVTYFAFKYTEDGVGKSLMEDTKILNSLRAMLTFSDVMASIRNSIGMTDVKMKLDEDDPDPYKTIEMTMGELLRAKQQQFPLGVNSPVDIVNYLQRAAYDFSFEGHPGLPDVTIEKSERSQNYPKPDSDLSDNLRKRAIMAYGLNPETVDNGFNSEFATSVVANNILLTRRVMQYQELFCPKLADHIKKVIYCSEGLMGILRDTVKKNFTDQHYDFEEIDRLYGKDNPNRQDLAIDYLLRQFIDGLETTLPRPDGTTLANQGEALKNFIELLDQGALDAWVSNEFFTSNFVGDIADTVEDFKKVIRAYFIRQFMTENNILPELSKITMTDEDDKPEVEFWEINQDHIKVLVKSLAQFIKNLDPTKTAGNIVIKNLGGEEGFTESSSSSSSSTPSGGGSSDFGMDDLGGIGGGFDETPPGSESETEPEPEAGTSGTPGEEGGATGEETPPDLNAGM